MATDAVLGFFPLSTLPCPPSVASAQTRAPQAKMTTTMHILARVQAIA
jgi:hypothetical protein